MVSAEEALRTAQVIRFNSVAAGTVIVLDHLITLDQEVELIWRSSNRAGKWLFILNRYYGLMTVIFNNYALFTPGLTDSWQGWSGTILCVIAELILQLRLFALYRLNRKVLVTMAVSFIVAVASSGTLMGVTLRDLSAHAVVLADITVCVPTNIPRYFYIFWIPILAFETLLCGLAVFRGFQSMRLKPSLYYSGKELVDVLFKDSVVYFIVLFTTYVANMVLFLVERKPVVEIPIAFGVAMSCIMANRLLLNIRQTMRDREDIMCLSPYAASWEGRISGTDGGLVEIEAT